MQNIEHRQIPRTKLDQLAYIHIEPNNGGIILNVSGVGLGFHSMARVERNGPLRFIASHCKRRIARLISGSVVAAMAANATGSFNLRKRGVRS